MVNMKDSLKHLPKHKRDDLRRLTETIRQTCGDVRTAECAYKSLLLVYTNYTPYNHFLDWFDKAIQEVIPDLPDFFPRETKEAEDRFNNFDHAYIGARYNPKYQISESDLHYFADRVELLMSETESRCQTFLQALPKSK